MLRSNFNIQWRKDKNRMEEKHRGILKLLPIVFFHGGFPFCGGVESVQGKEKVDLFPPLSGWKGPVAFQTFSPETLYEYINGAADLYLKYDFQELQVAEYHGTGKASLTIEIYRHRTPTHAFGIYSQERNPQAQFLPLGVQGFREEGLLVFVSGNFYVKITGSTSRKRKERSYPPSLKA